MRAQSLLLLSITFSVLATPLIADEPKMPLKKAIDPQYVRIAKDANDRSLAMQTSIIRYVSNDPKKAGLVVDLVGAVHIGEASYYRQLNQEFKQYDALLYEVVAPKGTVIPKGGMKSNGSSLNQLYNTMKDTLGLESQLAKVDYTAKNFVHADMTPEQLGKDMFDTSDELYSMWIKLLGQSIAQQTKPRMQAIPMRMLMASMSSEPEVAMKRIYAEVLAEQINHGIGSVGGPLGKSIVINRNKVALSVLAKEIKSGKKKVGIFYGAAHFPDMHKRLINEFGMKVESVRWLDAWNLKKKKK